VRCFTVVHEWNWLRWYTCEIYKCYGCTRVPYRCLRPITSVTRAVVQRKCFSISLSLVTSLVGTTAEIQLVSR